MQELISSAEASKLAGVSANTLQRFAEAGYLNTKGTEDSLFYQSAEVCALFGVSITKAKSFELKPAKQNLADSIVIETDVIETKPDIAEYDINESSEPSISKAEVNSATPPVQSSSNEEASRLRHVIELQEQLLSMKDREIEDLRQQREWYKERIEKLEQKAERDQLLLISETQMITRLITDKTRKSPVRLALEWLGLSEQENAPTTTIEVGANKSKQE